MQGKMNGYVGGVSVSAKPVVFAVAGCRAVAAGSLEAGSLEGVTAETAAAAVAVPVLSAFFCATNALIVSCVLAVPWWTLITVPSVNVMSSLLPLMLCSFALSVCNLRARLSHVSPPLARYQAD